MFYSDSDDELEETLQKVQGTEEKETLYKDPLASVDSEKITSVDEADNGTPKTQNRPVSARHAATLRALQLEEKRKQRNTQGTIVPNTPLTNCRYGYGKGGRCTSSIYCKHEKD